MTGKPVLVTGNTAAMLGENRVSWLVKQFEVSRICCKNSIFDVVCQAVHMFKPIT